MLYTSDICWRDAQKRFKLDSKGKFELMKFRGDNMCKRVLTADNVKKQVK